MDKDRYEALEDLKWLLLVLLIVWVVWYLTGGPARYEANNGVFLKPPAPLSTGETYGKLPDVKLKIPDTLDVSLYGGEATLGSNGNLRSTDPQKEYLEIVGQGGEPVDITGWKIVGSKGTSATIPGGIRVFESGKPNQASDIYLSQGERAILVTGSSPVGISFKVNSCSGYLAQFQDFIPKLKDACPSPLGSKDLEKYPLTSDCLDYIDNMNSCTTPTSALPKKLSPACRDFILTHTDYNSCVENNRDSGDFYSNEWRVYLNKEEELWGDHDTIKFYSREGNFIGTYVY